jgi:hypothetical protein
VSVTNSPRLYHIDETVSRLFFQNVCFVRFGMK